VLAGDLQKEVTNILHNAIDLAPMYGTYNVLCLKIVCINLRATAFEILPVCDLPVRLLCGCYESMTCFRAGAIRTVRVLRVSLRFLRRPFSATWIS
jgi:hypothetical protein